jgi:RNA polymerase sigma factor (sigma-70 family)
MTKKVILHRTLRGGGRGFVDEELYQIIYKAKRGNQQAFASLVKRYKGSVFRQAYAMVGDRGDAEDVAQDAFIKAYYSLGKLENEYAFTSWMGRIVSNACYDHLKKAKKKASVSLDENENAGQKEFTIEKSQMRLNIREAMQTLSQDHREAIVLRDIQGYSYQEIADILQIPVGTVKSRISNARLELKKELTRGESNG